MMNLISTKRLEERFKIQSQFRDTTRRYHRLRAANTMRTCPAVMFLLLLLILQADLTRGGFEQVCNLETRNEGPNSNGLCGPNLPPMINLLCKRFHRRSRSNNTTVEHKVKQDEIKNLRLKKSAAFSYLMKRQFGNQGIICECCYNHCSTAELLQYC